ncbi:hypothetical protein M569_02269 [Genlisea aurea]|uniref:DUF7733 domain-containing protein n=1 Tax=Genlisea aurea TaxID=192259 RepID=S8CZI8_9LAMI|nr:hypothetical protein M569_02269 [Genlisea aurea]
MRRRYVGGERRRESAFDGKRRRDGLSQSRRAAVSGFRNGILSQRLNPTPRPDISGDGHTAYILSLSKFVFPMDRKTSAESPEIFRGTKRFKFYVLAGTIVGIFLPLAYVLGGYAGGDEDAVKSAVPNLFLLSFQILTESVISGLSLFSPSVRALVPVIYTTRRIFIILDWMKHAWIF